MKTYNLFFTVNNKEYQADINAENEESVYDIIKTFIPKAENIVIL